MNPDQPSTRKRIFELDLLRGFFIFVIIVDHVQRWPSPLTYITGEGRLWVSAAEGFFIISGLLIGYLRGYKGLKLPFSSIATLLFKRTGVLYLWSVIVTFVAVWLIGTFSGDPSLVPKGPETSGLTYIWQVLTQQYVFDWIYFLRLYWIMLLITPLVIWLFRIRKWWLVPVLSLSVYGLSFLLERPEAALQWQTLFFIPAAIGIHLETIRGYLAKHATLRRWILGGLISTTLITMILSYFWVLGWGYVESGKVKLSLDSYLYTRGWLDPYFTKDPLAWGRLLLSFVWFGGLLALFHLLRDKVMRWLSWLLLPFGQYSLTAYCLQAITLLFVQFFVPPSTHWLINLLISLGSVLLVWGLLKLPIVRRLLPQ